MCSATPAASPNEPSATAVPFAPRLPVTVDGKLSAGDSTGGELELTGGEVAAGE